MALLAYTGSVPYASSVQQRSRTLGGRASMRPKRKRAMRDRSPSDFSILPLAAVFLAAGAIASTAPLAAQSPSISVPQVSCFRFADNQVVRATTLGEPGGATARLYFQWTDHPYYYWVDFEHDGPGRYWVTPPKPA